LPAPFPFAPPRSSDDRGTMIERLGKALYWLGCIVTALVIGTGWLGPILDTAQVPPWYFALIAAIGRIIWLIGCACRYVLAGP
jgi:hypothetical protein